MTASTVTALGLATADSAAHRVANSAGTAAAKLKAPPNACDCHMHIYDPARFPMPPHGGKRAAPTHAEVAEYQKLQQRIGTTRVVIVQPRHYGTDNRVTLDAIARLGHARGVAVVHPTITDAELKAFDAAGIRGIRFSLGDPATSVVKPEMIEPLAKRIAGLGWHIQFNMEGEQIVALADLLRRLPTQIVIDHLGHPTQPAGVRHASHAIVRELLDQGRAWVKLSGAYYAQSEIGAPLYPEATQIAQSFVQAAPERLVWGSDWPHPPKPIDDKPDDALLFDLLSVWAPDTAVRHRILVTNPEALYGFAQSA